MLHLPQTEGKHGGSQKQVAELKELRDELVTNFREQMKLRYIKTWKDLEQKEKANTCPIVQLIHLKHSPMICTTYLDGSHRCSSIMRSKSFGLTRFVQIFFSC